MSDEAHFYLLGFFNKQNPSIGQPQTPKKFIRDHFRVPKSQYGVIFGKWTSVFQ
jgi:hypothetical protein